MSINVRQRVLFILFCFHKHFITLVAKTVDEYFTNEKSIEKFILMEYCSMNNP